MSHRSSSVKANGEIFANEPDVAAMHPPEEQ
jgi:hypothetical protein